MLRRTESQGYSEYDWKTMPRSAPGSLSGFPSIKTSPSLGWIRPAAMLSRVDLPQPEGPTMQANCPSGTVREVRSRARTSRDPVVKRMATSANRISLMTSVQAREPAYPIAAETRVLLDVGKRPAVENAEEEVGHQPQDPDRDDGGDDPVGPEVAFGDQDEVPDPGVGRDQLGDDQVGPGPAHGDPQHVDDLGPGGRQKDLAKHRRPVGPEGVGDVQHLAGHALRDVRHHQDELEEDAEPDHRDLLVLAQPLEQDQERDEGRGRHVAHEVEDRLEECANRLEGSHQQTQGHGDHRRQDEAGHDPEG